MPFTETECRACRRDFPALSRTLGGRPVAFLDGPAGAQVPRQVIAAVVHYYERTNANTHGAFATSFASDRLLAAAREAVAAFLGAESWRQISFGQNMTSLTFALSHALGRRLRPGDEVVVTQLDHEANRGPWRMLAERGAVVREVALLPDGRLDAADLERKVGERTRIVALGWASNALGTVNDVARARRLATAAGAWLVVDAVHYAPHFPIDAAALGADFLLCSAYKFYGPHVGVLCARPGLLDELATDRLSTQDPAAPYRIETGTLNHAAIAGVKAAIEYLASWGEGETLRRRVVSAMAAIAAYEHGLARRYFVALAAIPGVRVWGPDFSSPLRAPTVSITVEGWRPSEVARRLAAAGLQVWDGHFYAVRAMEVLGLAERGGVVRTGFLMYNTAEEVDRLVAAVGELVGEATAAASPKLEEAG
jgi:cysteine desulfurase family protein (TIGR01976 family)